MIRSKSNGFTLIEALLALMIMGLVFTPMYVSQSQLFQVILHGSARIERLLQARSFLLDARRAIPKDAQQFVLEKKEKKPVTFLKYELKSLNDDSPFKKIPNLYKEELTLQWQEDRNKFTDTLVNFVYRPKSTPS